MNQTTISKIISFIISASFFALLIFLLPTILVILGVIVLLLIIAGFVFRYFLLKKIKMNFVYRQQAQNATDETTDEIDGMKDVTNSYKDN